VFGTGFVLGTLRVLFLVPRLGERAAELLEMPLMFAAIYLAARFTVRRFSLAPRAGVRLLVGALALTLLIGAELLLAVGIQDQSVAVYIASRDPVSGTVYLGGLLAFALMPLLLALLQSSRLPS
jgi:hypothetical protein